MKLLKITILFLVLTTIFALPIWTVYGQDEINCDQFYKDQPLKIEQCKNLQKVGAKSYGTVFTGEQAETTLAFKVGQVAGMVLSVFGVVFLGLVIYSGIQWMTAGGNEEKVTKAKGRIMRAAIGLGIIMMAWALTRFVVTRMQTPTYAPTSNTCRTFDNEEDCQFPYCVWHNDRCVATQSCADRLPQDCSDPRYLDNQPVCGEGKTCTRVDDGCACL